MKRLLIILILTFSFQNLSKADDIREFEIEGIAMGNSALDFFSEQKLKTKISRPINLKNTLYTQSCFNNYGDLYDRICVAYKKDSSKKIIESIQAQIRYNEDVMNVCREEQRKIDKDLSLLFKNLERKEWGKKPLKSLKDIDPDAYYYPITYEFVDKSRSQVGCYNISNKSILKVAVYNLEFAIVLRN